MVERRLVQNNKVFGSGGTGFVGKRVIAKLKEGGINYITASQNSEVDFRDLEQTKRFFEQAKPDYVINCAAFVGGIKFGLERQGEIFFNNILMATNLMEAARLSGVKRFVNPISNCAYPEQLTKFKEKRSIGHF